MILISGFRPFKNLSYNPSEDLVNEINIKGIEKIILPVKYGLSFESLKKKIEQVKPNKVVMFGLAQSRQKISQEKYAHNLSHCSLADNAGVKKTDHIIIANQTQKLQTSIKFYEGENWEISEDAGKYVCNDLYFRTLDYSQNRSIECIFIHIPLKAQFDLKSEVENYLLTHF